MSLAIACVLVSGGARVDTSSPTSGDAQHTQRGEGDNSTKYDDLMWLVGRWRCLTREYIGKHRGDDPGKPLSYVSEDFLEYFDVFYPYVDENFTTELFSAPHYRQIAAQLLVRRVMREPPFKEELIPMDPHGDLIEICKDTLRVGGPLSNYTLKYTRIETNHPPRLILESAVTRITLEKWSRDAGDIHSSYVRQPVYYYPLDALADLSSKYDKLRAETKH